MATPIIAALRQRTDLKESLLHTAQELAHLARVRSPASTASQIVSLLFQTNV